MLKPTEAFPNSPVPPLRPLEIPLEQEFVTIEQSDISSHARELLRAVRATIVNYNLDSCHLYSGNTGIKCQAVEFMPDPVKPEAVAVTIRPKSSFGNNFLRVTANADRTIKVDIRRTDINRDPTKFRFGVSDSDMSFTTQADDPDRMVHVGKIVAFLTEYQPHASSWFHGRPEGSPQSVQYYARQMGVPFQEHPDPAGWHLAH